MGFTLRHLRTGETKAFSTKEVLEMLGDPVNDEIIVHNEVYRISSFVGTDNGDVTLPTIKWNQTRFTYSAKIGNTTYLLDSSTVLLLSSGEIISSCSFSPGRIPIILVGRFGAR